MNSISVAMATFNGERFLTEQLASLTRQTLLPAELVVCDDGSNDGTYDALERFATASPFPVRLERNEEQIGFADTFLRAASLCRGDLIALCDQDDVWLDHKLARCAAAWRDDVVLVMHSSRVVDDELESTGALYPRFRDNAIAPPLSTDPWLAVRGMSMVFSGDLVRQVDWTSRPPSHYLPGQPINHDEWIYLLARGMGSIAFLAEPLALYRRHPTAVTGAAPGRRRRFGKLFSTGWTYYEARREQAVALAEAFERLAAGDAGDGTRNDPAARSYRTLAERTGVRLQVYDPEATRAVRARRLARLIRSGAYGRRGFGPFAGARDAVMITLGRRG